MKDPFEEASADVDRRGATYILLTFVFGLVALAVFNPGSRGVLALIIGVVAMVMLHEAGHYIAAKKTGMKATEFFVGFGPRLWSFKRGETEFGVKAILLGGYVRIIGMTNVEDVDPADESRTYRRGSTKNRLIVVLAGVTVNVILAVVLFTAFFAIQGHTNEAEYTTTIHRVSHYVRKADGTFLHDEGGKKIVAPAHTAGFEVGDRIIAINGKRVTGWMNVVRKIEARPSEEVTFTVVRDSTPVDLDATPLARGDQGFVGISSKLRYDSVSPLQAVPESFKAVGDITAGTFSGLAHLFSPDGISEYGKNFTSNAPKAGSTAAETRPRSLVGIIDLGSEIVNGDWAQLLWLLGVISLILAIFNTLPLLPFDGGHAAVVVYEAIASKVKGREVRADFRKLMPVTAVVLAVFLTLGLSAMFLDIRDAVGG